MNENQESNLNLDAIREQLKKLQQDLAALRANVPEDGDGKGDSDTETGVHATAPEKSDGDSKEESKDDSKDDSPDDSDDKSDDERKAKGKKSDDEKKDDEPKKKVPLKERLKKMSLGKKLALVSVILVLIGSGAYFGYQQYKFENTDDAYVQAYSTQIAPKVSGIVTHVLVVENQKVRAGQILVQIDRKDYVAAFEDARASRGSIEAQYKNAQDDYRRMKMLVRDKAISQQTFDRSESNLLNLERQMKAADARIDEARLNLDYTSVRAPVDGMIARRSIDIGMYAASGTAVLGFVPADERWIDANFKETQLSSIVPGSHARVTVDAVKGQEYDGVVESISPATGATFTLLPPDNATGNFTKVVQRVPVRIRLKNLKPEDLAALQAGLSAEVDIYKHEDPDRPDAPRKAIFEVSEIRSPEPPLSSDGLHENQAAGIVPPAPAEEPPAPPKRSPETE